LIDFLVRFGSGQIVVLGGHLFACGLFHNTAVIRQHLFESQLDWPKISARSTLDEHTGHSAIFKHTKNK
jgi:hypothetical protein